MSLADAPASHDDRKVLVLRLAELGVPTTDTEGQRHVCAVWTGGLRRTRSELTKRDVGTLLARLSTMTPDEVTAVRHMPIPGVGPATEPEPVPDAAPAVDPAACLATWDLDDFEGRNPLPGREEPDDDEEEHVPEPDPAPAGSVAPAVPLVAPLPVASPPPAEPAPERVVTCEPPCRTPEEVEAAAVAAVERFRERQAAGIVPEPPDRLAVPRRVPLDLPPHPGRYCLTRCYCGACPQHAEQAEAAERAYRQELTAARNKDLRTR